MRGDPDNRRSPPCRTAGAERPALSAEAVQDAGSDDHGRSDPDLGVDGMRAPQAPRRVVLPRPRRVTTAPSLLRDLEGGDRRALARAITLAESTRPDHRAEAEEM